MTLDELTSHIESSVEGLHWEIGTGSVAPTGEPYLQFANGFIVQELERVPLIATSEEAAVECFFAQFRNYLDTLNRRYETMPQVKGTLYWREKPALTKFYLRAYKSPIDAQADHYIVHASLLISGKATLQASGVR